MLRYSNAFVVTTPVESSVCRATRAASPSMYAARWGGTRGRSGGRNGAGRVAAGWARERAVNTVGSLRRVHALVMSEYRTLVVVTTLVLPKHYTPIPRSPDCVQRPGGAPRVPW